MIPPVKLLGYDASVTEALMSSAETKTVTAWDDPSLLSIYALDCTLHFVDSFSEGLKDVLKGKLMRGNNINLPPR